MILKYGIGIGIFLVSLTLGEKASNAEIVTSEVIKSECKNDTSCGEHVEPIKKNKIQDNHFIEIYIMGYKGHQTLSPTHQKYLQPQLNLLLNRAFKTSEGKNVIYDITIKDASSSTPPPQVTCPNPPCRESNVVLNTSVVLPTVRCLNKVCKVRPGGKVTQKVPVKLECLKGHYCNITFLQDPLTGSAERSKQGPVANGCVRGMNCLDLFFHDNEFDHEQYHSLDGHDHSIEAHKKSSGLHIKFFSTTNRQPISEKNLKHLKEQLTILVRRAYHTLKNYEKTKTRMIKLKSVVTIPKLRCPLKRHCSPDVIPIQLECKRNQGCLLTFWPQVPDAKPTQISSNDTTVLQPFEQRHSKLPQKVVAFYILLADDTEKGFGTDADWIPQLYPYQQIGSNVLFFTFINPETMKIPKTFQKLAATRGTNAEGAIPKDTLIMFAIGGYAYSIKYNPWKWLTSKEAAEAMAEEVATWPQRYGCDGIDLDIEEGAGSRHEAGPNMVHFIRRLIQLNPKIIIGQPTYGYPQVQAEIDVINTSWDTNSNSLNLADSIGLMVYEGSEALRYVDNYAKGAQQWQGFPVKVNVPRDCILLGSKGQATSQAIMHMAQESLRQNLLGIMVWYASVKNGFQYEKTWDASTDEAAKQSYMQAMSLFRNHMTEKLM